MTNTAPPVDARTGDQVSAQIRNLLKLYVRDEHGGSALVDPDSGDLAADPFRDALIAIAGRYAELIIQRLNLVPQKNFVAFLDLLGASQQPPQPARVPLTFALSASSTVPTLVPAETQVAAAPAPGQPDPTIFETERDFVVIPAGLTAAFVRDPSVDRYADVTAIVAGVSDTGLRVFEGARKVDHILYLGFTDLFRRSGMSSVRLTFEVTPATQVDARQTSWEYWSGTDWTGIEPTVLQDQTQALQASGTINLGALPPLPVSTLDGVEDAWLRCSLITPINALSPRPSISTIRATVTLTGKGLPLTAAFSNSTLIDVTKDFFPFGETPRFGDTFFLRCDEAFSIPHAVVTLHLALTNPVESNSTSPPKTNASGKPALNWETWNGSSWVLLGTSTPDGSSAPAGAIFADATKAFTTNVDQKPIDTVRFVSPSKVGAVTVNGVEGYWLRVRISGGNYGLGAGYAQDGTVTPPTFAAPVIKRVSVEYSYDMPDAQPDAVLAFNDFAFAHASPGAPFEPFRAMTDTRPTLYLGFELIPGTGPFPNRSVSLYAKASDCRYDTSMQTKATSPAPPATVRPARLVWEYRSLDGWCALGVRDETQNLSRSGIIEVLVPPGFSAQPDFGVGQRYWIRVRWQDGDYAVTPELVRILMNTTMASQTVTTRNEILGSSDGSKNQRFTATRGPILPGQCLELREPEVPSIAEAETLKAEEGDDAIRADQHEIWVRWHEVPDFYGSDPRARHYVLDRLGARILFGDGENGLVPPTGVNNIRLTRYQTGGGVMGNRAAGTVIQLKTTVPYVDKVTNLEAAAGGADAESIGSVGDRVPREIRHGGRAVTIEDHEDLAREASPQVARAKCIPLMNLAADAHTQAISPGCASVIIVPQSTDAMPVPTMELIRRVQDYLDARRDPTEQLSVVGPAYVEVKVTAEIVPTSLDAATRALNDVQERVVAFLHPLTGGFDGNGWDFGRQPHESDLYALIESVETVDHVRSLAVVPIGSAKALATRRFLVYSGTPTISVVLES